MTVSWQEFMAFRRELVEAERSHPEWRKKFPGCAIVPDAPGAKTYWRLRNGSRGIVRHRANGLDDLAQAPGYIRRIAQMGADASLSGEEEGLVSKWMAEWEALKRRYNG